MKNEYEGVDNFVGIIARAYNGLTSKGVPPAEAMNGALTMVELFMAINANQQSFNLADFEGNPQ